MTYLWFLSFKNRLILSNFEFSHVDHCGVSYIEAVVQKEMVQLRFC